MEYILIFFRTVGRYLSLRQGVEQRTSSPLGCNEEVPLLLQDVKKGAGNPASLLLGRRCLSLFKG
jgi:hypothetical protein